MSSQIVLHQFHSNVIWTIKMFNHIKIEDIFSDSESELERECDVLYLYLMNEEEDEENNNSALSTRKRNTSRR